MSYGVIYADPAWKFEVWDRDTGMGRSAESHYPTMSLPQMKAMPVKDLASERCALIMWAVMPMLPEALELGAAWGFQYKTTLFTWAKTRKKAAPGERWDDSHTWHIGMGYYSRANAELALLFTTKKPPQRLAKNVRQLLVAPVGDHSAKPDEAYNRIERLFPGPYLELFARRQHSPNWDVWGNQVTSSELAARVLGGMAAAWRT